MKIAYLLYAFLFAIISYEISILTSNIDIWGFLITLFLGITFGICIIMSILPNINIDDDYNLIKENEK